MPGYTSCMPRQIGNDTCRAAHGGGISRVASQLARQCKIQRKESSATFHAASTTPRGQTYSIAERSARRGSRGAAGPMSRG